MFKVLKSTGYGQTYLLKWQKLHTFAASFLFMTSSAVMHERDLLVIFWRYEKRLAVMLASSFLWHRTQVRRYIFIFRKWAEKPLECQESKHDNNLYYL